MVFLSSKKQHVIETKLFVCANSPEQTEARKHTHMNVTTSCVERFQNTPQPEARKEVMSYSVMFT
jgi:hypothetical protein